MSPNGSMSVAAGDGARLESSGSECSADRPALEEENGEGDDGIAIGPMEAAAARAAATATATAAASPPALSPSAAAAAQNATAATAAGTSTNRTSTSNGTIGQQSSEPSCEGNMPTDDPSLPVRSNENESGTPLDVTKPGIAEPSSMAEAAVAASTFTVAKRPRYPTLSSSNSGSSSSNGGSSNNSRSSSSSSKQQNSSKSAPFRQAYACPPRRDGAHPPGS